MVLSGPPLGAVQSREMCPFNIESVILRQANTMRRLAYEFTTSIALHGLSLTVTSVVVGPSTFVARRRAGSTSHSSSEAAAISTARHHSATASSGPRLQSCTRTRTLCNRLSFPSTWLARYTYSKMTWLAASIAATAGLGTTQA